MFQLHATASREQFDAIAIANFRAGKPAPQTFNAIVSGRPATVHMNPWQPVFADDPKPFTFGANRGDTQGYPDATPKAQALLDELTWGAS